MMDLEESDSLWKGPLDVQKCSIIHLGNQVSRWEIVKMQNALKTNEEVAKTLLDSFNRVAGEKNPTVGWKSNHTASIISRHPQHIPDIQTQLELHWNQVQSLNKSYSSCTIRGIPLFTPFKARFDQALQPNDAPSTFILIPFAPQPGTKVVDISNDRSTIENTGSDDSGACLSQIIDENIIVKTEPIDSFLSTDIKQDIDVNTCSDTKLDNAFESNKEPTELLSENQDLVETNDNLNDRGLYSDEVDPFETYLANKHKVKYFHDIDDDDDEQSRLSLRKSDRIRTVGFRPNYSALELPSSSEGEENDSGKEVDSIDEEKGTNADRKGEFDKGQINKKKTNNKSKEDQDYKPDDNDEDDEDGKDVICKEDPDVKAEDDTTEVSNGVDKNVKNTRTLKRKKNKDNDSDFDLSDMSNLEKYKKKKKPLKKEVLGNESGENVKDTRKKKKDNVTDFDLSDMPEPKKYKKERKPLKKEILGSKAGENVNGTRKRGNNAVMKKKRNLITLKKDISKLKETNKWITVDLDNQKGNFEMVECSSTAQKDRNTDVIEVLYSCLICKALKTDNRAEFQNHVENHVNGILKCTQCGCECRDPVALLKHERTVHNFYGQNKVKVCEVCGVGCMDNKSYRSHMAREHLQAAWTCQYCNEKFISLKQQRHHQREKHADKFTICQKCNRYLLGKGYNFEKHVRHCNGPDLKKQCEECGKTFHPGQLQRHITLVHHRLRRFQCKYCSYSGKKSTNLKHHLLIHEGLKPYTCKDCGQSFTQPYQLTSHMRTHTGEKPFKCDQCPYAAAWNVQLKDHKKAHDSDQAVTCTECGIVLKNKTFRC
ncbi:ZN283-like protein [Mya arenaria]|uniref:ZN283-like protein n=1 Tax=Mya arenaria TaxID=6604 RepID=A0ABY7FA87_MYAAR|nr:ZN283-like protein [Mya arenaria]